MVSQFDSSYNNIYRRPVYDSKSDQTRRRFTREADELFEKAVPPIPTPEDEVEYIDWLKEDFMSDPWVTHRFRKYMAGPKRVPWKNMRQLKKQYQYNFTITWILGFGLTWPLATVIGRRMQSSFHGVPIVPLQWYKHDFINVSPGVYARKQFRLYAFGSALALGWLFAYALVDRDGWRSDKLRNRPDMKPKAAMVKTDEENDIMYQTMRRSLYKDA